MKLNRNILNRIITEAMTNLAYEDINPSNEIDGIESVENEEEYNPLDDSVNHMYENRKRTIKLTEAQVNKIVRNSIYRIIKECK